VFGEKYVMHGRSVEERYGLPSSTQPDLFSSTTDVVSIEMKLNAKSSIEQILKYALLGLADEIVSAREKQHYLAFLAPGEFPSLWKDRYPDVAQLIDKLRQSDFSGFLGRQSQRLRTRTARFKQIVETLTFGHLTYTQVVGFLQRIEGSGSDTQGGASVYRKLIDGLVGELRLRELA